MEGGRADLPLYRCHNFYPKQFTALSLESVREINRRLRCLGFDTMGFVPGNKELRGPLQEGLPTVEEHLGAAGRGAFKYAGAFL